MKNGRPRILFIMPLPPPIHGSAVVSKQILDSVLINTSFNCDYVNLSTSRRMQEIGHASPIKFWRVICSFLKTFWLLIIHRYDLCYLAITCHGTGFLKDSPFVLLCKLFRRKIIIHQHNKGMSDDIDKWPYRWLLPMCYKKAKVILLSWHLYPDIEKIVPKSDVVICPNGITLNETIQSREVPVDHRTSHFLFLSNLIYSKGVIVLLDALKILHDKGYGFVCDFVGGETKEMDSNKFKDEVEYRDLTNKVMYWGPKYGETKSSFFRLADSFVLPSYDDCFPLVILEAMSYHLPIISTNEGGIPDIVQDGLNGLICGRKNSVLLADCLEKLLLNPELGSRLGNEGYRLLKERFTRDVFLNNMHQILNDTLNDKNNALP